ncbi:[acyl-carrier-protein] S-malonyltransferase [Kluyveromyces marxianus]|nr:[acyl-carrier-protein] S-malonyltransferase [Kluyveromyces marxianus]KAG0678269.1 [acyl-carrier-protein] S-malonyltransferase [Kluyveromyces marxianus]
MSRTNLLSFPGQGSKILLERFNHWCVNVSTFNNTNLINEFKNNLEKPESVAACSNLLHKYWLSKNERNKSATTYVIGHSLGELNALNASVNGIAFQCRDVMNIASFRNNLMIQAKQDYMRKNTLKDESYELWAITNFRSKDLRKDLLQLLKDSDANSVKLANDNAVNQCVVTGLPSDINKFKEFCQLCKLKLKFSQLSNPFSIPFHNSNILRPIQEPLYDYIWDILKENGMQQLANEKVENPIISNVDGKLTNDFHTALEKFVVGSSEIVNFVASCHTIASELDVEEAYHFGPGNSIGKLIERNLKGFSSAVTHHYID